jgi:phosphoglucomutase
VHARTSAPPPDSPADAIDDSVLEREYFARRPDPASADRRVPSGHGALLGASIEAFSEAHVLALTQAVCDVRRSEGLGSALYVARDAAPLSALAHASALEVLTSNGLETVVHRDGAVTPPSVLSWLVRAHNRCRRDQLADGMLFSRGGAPSQGVVAYQWTSGGPPPPHIARAILDRANALLRDDNAAVRRIPLERRASARGTHARDFVRHYVDDLRNVLDLEAVRSAGLELLVDLPRTPVRPMWEAIAASYRLAISATGRHDLALAYDASSNRYAVGTPAAGWIDPQRQLAVALRYLLLTRPWPASAAALKHVATTALLDRGASTAGRGLSDLGAGLEWKVPGLLESSCCFAADDDGGAVFLRGDGTPWAAGSDGILMGLLAGEMTARTGEDPGQRLRALTAELGDPCSVDVLVPAVPDAALGLRSLGEGDAQPAALAGEPVIGKTTRCLGGDEPLGGLKVVARNGWFVAQPCAGGDGYRIFAESFLGSQHLERVVGDARSIVARALGSAARGAPRSPLRVE